MNPTTSRSPSFILCAASSAKSLSKPPPSTRCFSSTPSCAGRKKYKPPTRQRRGLYRWLTQTGSHLYAPAFGSTNYLSAYDASGRLKRVVEARAKEAAELELKGEVVQYDSAGNPILDKKAKIPPETTRDLTPFPLNKRFISQPVLSDEFREMIYSQIMVEGKSVRDVSVEFNVDMRRVGAVVRLKEVEKQWQASVSFHPALLPSPVVYDDTIPYRLVLKTAFAGKYCAFGPLVILSTLTNRSLLCEALADLYTTRTKNWQHDIIKQSWVCCLRHSLNATRKR